MIRTLQRTDQTVIAQLHTWSLEQFQSLSRISTLKMALSFMLLMTMMVAMTMAQDPPMANFRPDLQALENSLLISRVDLDDPNVADQATM